MSDAGYSLEEIRAERERRNRSTRLQAGATGEPVTLEAIRRERARRSSAGQQQQPQQPPGYNDVTGAIHTLNSGIPFSDEMSGAGVGVLEMGRDIARGNFDDLGGAYQRGYRIGADDARGQAQAFRRRHPGGAAAVQGVGAAVPMVATMGASAPEQMTAQAIRSQGTRQAEQAALQAQRGPALLARQSAQAGGTGAAYGAVYGAGEGDGDMADRLAHAATGAEAGAAFGAAVPAAFNAVRPAAMAMTERLGPALRPDRSSVGAFGGNLFSRGGGSAAPPPESQLPPAARNTITRLADRNRMGADDVERELAAARDNRQGQVTADIFGDSGVRTTRAVAQAPGQSGERAAEVARQRFQEAPDRIIGALNRRLGVGQSPTQAMAALEQDYAQASADLYTPLFERPTTPQQRALYEQRIAPLTEDPVLQDAMHRGEAIFERERRLGTVDGAIDDNLARYLHYTKMGLDDAIGAARRNPTGIQSTEMRGVTQLRRRFVEAVDEIVPGYREARARWGGLREAEDALTEGANFLNMKPDEVSAAMGELTPFAQHHARIGLANAIETRLGTRGSVNGNRNVAEALGSPEMQRRVAAAFETPAQAADFLDVLNTQNRLMRNAGQWGGGSSTYSNATHGADDALHTAVETGGHAITGNFGGAVRRATQGTVNAITGGMVERANNIRGEALLRRIDGPEAKAFADEIVRILRQREASRAATSAVAAPAGATAGVITSRDNGQN